MLSNFSFQVDDLLAGSARPGSWGSIHDDILEAKSHGVTLIVSLTESPLPKALMSEAGVEYIHMPVVDFSPPTIAQMVEFIALVEKQKEKGGAVLAHCQAGMGRTGTMLAAYLVSRGKDSMTAIEEVRRNRPGSIETMEQEEAVISFEKHLKDRPKK